MVGFDIFWGGSRRSRREAVEAEMQQIYLRIERDLRAVFGAEVVHLYIRQVEIEMVPHDRSARVLVLIREPDGQEMLHTVPLHGQYLCGPHELVTYLTRHLGRLCPGTLARTRQQAIAEQYRMEVERLINPPVFVPDFGDPGFDLPIRRAIKVTQAAYDKAWALLVANLTVEQNASLRQRKFFRVRGGETGRIYEIHTGRTNNIRYISEDGRRWGTMCVVPHGALQLGDVMLAQKLALECDEERTWAVANRQGMLPIAAHVDAVMRDFLVYGTTRIVVDDPIRPLTD